MPGRFWNDPSAFLKQSPSLIAGTSDASYPHISLFVCFLFVVEGLYKACDAFYVKL